MKNLKKAAAFFAAAGMLFASVPAFAATGDDETFIANVTMNGDSVEIEKLIDTTGISAAGQIITITASGAYKFTGTLNDGQICVNIPDETVDTGTVKLYFDGVDITGVTEAPVYIVNAENTSINIMDGTTNTLTDGGLYTETEAVIYAKDDLTIKGATDETAGTLTVTSGYQHGIHCNNDLKVNGGILKVRTEDGDGLTYGGGDGIRGKTSVEIKAGKIDVNASGDGVKSTKGTVTISGGETEIKAGNDAVQGETALDISGGTLKANGDRGLRLDLGTINITGGSVLATATDYQVNNEANSTTVNATQPTLLFSFTEEQLKDQEIALVAQDSTTAFAMTPDKKFDHILISDAAIKEAVKYTLTVAGNAAAFDENSVSYINNQDSESTSVNRYWSMTGSEGTFTLYSTNVTQEVVTIDVDCDGEETLKDAVLLAKMISGDSATAETVTAAQSKAADINRDGEINGKDLTLCLRSLAGYDISE